MSNCGVWPSFVYLRVGVGGALERVSAPYTLTKRRTGKREGSPKENVKTMNVSKAINIRHAHHTTTLLRTLGLSTIYRTRGLRPTLYLSLSLFSLLSRALSLHRALVPYARMHARRSKPSDPRPPSGPRPPRRARTAPPAFSQPKSNVALEFTLGLALVVGLTPSRRARSLYD